MEELESESYDLIIHEVNIATKEMGKVIIPQ